MTLDEALQHLFESEKFKEAAKNQSNSSLRVYLLRYRNNTLKEISAKRLLKKFGYKETWIKN